MRQAHLTDDVQVFIQDDYQNDALVIQVRAPQPMGTVALGYAMEDMDAQPALLLIPLADEDRRTMRNLDPKPGLRVRHAIAVKMAQAILEATKAPADPSEKARLEKDLAEVTEGYNRLDADLAVMTMERDAARESVVHLERLLEATQAHLEREARTADHFHRPVETEQAKTEVETARSLHPAQTVRLQDQVNDALARLRRP